VTNTIAPPVTGIIHHTKEAVNTDDTIDAHSAIIIDITPDAITTARSAIIIGIAPDVITTVSRSCITTTNHIRPKPIRLKATNFQPPSVSPDGIWLFPLEAVGKLFDLLNCAFFSVDVKVIVGPLTNSVL
jgi:hypothetical protein